MNVRVLNIIPLTSYHVSIHKESYMMYAMHVAVGMGKAHLCWQSSPGLEFKAAAFTRPATVLELLLHSFKIKHR